MNLDVPDDILNRAEANAADMRLALALQFYTDNRIDHGDAVRLSGMPEALFNQELLARKISLQKYPGIRQAAG